MCTLQLKLYSTFLASGGGSLRGQMVFILVNEVEGSFALWNSPLLRMDLLYVIVIAHPPIPQFSR